MQPRGVVLVEGASDRRAVETLARRRGRDLQAEGVAIVPMDGYGNLPRLLGQYRDLRIAGLYDVGEERHFARVGVRRPARARARRVLRLHARPRGRADAGVGAGWNGARARGARRAARVPDLPEAARAPRPAARGTAARLHVEPQAEVRRVLGGDTRPRARPAAARQRLGARLAQRTCERHAVATEG